MNEATSKSNEIKEVKKELKYLLIRLGIFIAVIWLLFAKVILICRAPDNGMFPAIKSGDLIIGFRITGDLRRDDVILYEHDGKTYSGRVMGCEGDIITIDESGICKRNADDRRDNVPHISKRGCRISSYNRRGQCIRTRGLQA